MTPTALPLLSGTFLLFSPISPNPSVFIFGQNTIAEEFAKIYLVCLQSFSLILVICEDFAKIGGVC